MFHKKPKLIPELILTLNYDKFAVGFFNGDYTSVNWKNRVDFDYKLKLLLLLEVVVMNNLQNNNLQNNSYIHLKRDKI